jgi:four helix bundle protein
MAKVNSFEELEVWKLARILAGKIHSFSSQGDFCKEYGFKDQIQRAAVSIVSNVAEGFERQSTNQFLHFLDIAIGSAAPASNRQTVKPSNRQTIS